MDDVLDDDNDMILPLNLLTLDFPPPVPSFSFLSRFFLFSR